MPSLNDMLSTPSLKGFEAVEHQLPAPMKERDSVVALNPYLRCPLPPFSTTVDTIRQWNMSGKTPVMRVIPLPNQQGAGGGTSTNITKVTTTTSGGGSGGTTVPVTLTPVTAFINIPFLPPQATFTAVMLLSKSFQPLQLMSTVPVEVRFYSNLITQAIDLARETDLAVGFDSIEGVITDIVFDDTLQPWNWENRVGANADSPQGVNIYVTVVNPSETTSTNAGTITLVFLPLES